MSDPRTDLLCERIDAQPELYSNRGLLSSDFMRNGLKIRRMTVEDEKTSQAVGKPPGIYCTVECKGLESADGDAFLSMLDAIASQLRSLLGPPEEGLLFVVGLGNLEITPDALGPRAVSHIIASRHIRREAPELFSRLSLGEVAALSPGVLGQTGLESGDIVLAITEKVKPRAVIVIDSLAALDPERLCSTVQLSNTGIAPGSGIGNRRIELSPATLHLPVLAIGIPMVISAGALSGGEDRGLIVTPKNIDLLVGRAARLLGYAINRYAHKGLSVEDMDSLLS